jgi:hypothetical protein
MEEFEGDERRKRGRKAGVTNSEIESRNDEIVRDRLRQQSWKHIATKHGLSTAQCRAIYERWKRENPGTYQGRPPIELVQKQLEALEAWTEQLAEIADVSDVDTTKIQAINAQADKVRQAAEIMQATGILPHDLGVLRLELDVQALAGRLVQVLVENDAPVELKRAILAELKAGTPSNGATDDVPLT